MFSKFLENTEAITDNKGWAVRQGMVVQGVLGIILGSFFDSFSKRLLCLKISGFDRICKKKFSKVIASFNWVNIIVDLGLQSLL